MKNFYRITDNNIKVISSTTLIINIKWYLFFNDEKPRSHLPFSYANECLYLKYRLEKRYRLKELGVSRFSKELLTDPPKCLSSSLTECHLKLWNMNDVFNRMNLCVCILLFVRVILEISFIAWWILMPLVKTPWRKMLILDMRYINFIVCIFLRIRKTFERLRKNTI